MNDQKPEQSLKSLAESLPQRTQTDSRFTRPKGAKPLKNIRERQHRVAQLLVRGLTNRQIATVTGYTEAWISTLRHDPLVQEQIKALTERTDDTTITLATEIAKTAPQALKVMQAIMVDEDASASVRSGIARDILDRSGHAAPKQVNVAHAHLTSDDIENLKSRARSSGIITADDPENDIEIPFETV